MTLKSLKGKNIRLGLYPLDLINTAIFLYHAENKDSQMLPKDHIIKKIIEEWVAQVKARK
jgi:hypothetical protein